MKDNPKMKCERLSKNDSNKNDLADAPICFFSQKLEQDILIETECSDSLQPYMGLGNTGWMKHGGWSRGDW